MPEHEIDGGLIIKHKQPQPDNQQKIVRVGIVIPVLNNFEGCVDLLQSIRSKHIVSVYVMPQYRTQHREHSSLSTAWNKGSKRAFTEGCDYALVCNDDIMFAPETIDNMVAEMERLQPDVVMVSASNILGEMPDKFSILNHYLKDGEEQSVADHPDFSCFMISKDFFDQMGTFDEKFYPAWHEDQDMHNRIHLAGKRAVTSTKCPIVHLIGVTTSKLPSEINSSISDGHMYEKWGGANPTPPQPFKTPYNNPNMTYKEW